MSLDRDKANRVYKALLEFDEGPAMVFWKGLVVPLTKEICREAFLSGNGRPRAPDERQLRCYIAGQAGVSEQEADEALEMLMLLGDL